MTAYILTPSADAMIRSGAAYQSVNYGTSTNLIIGEQSSSIYQRSLLKFDLTNYMGRKLTADPLLRIYNYSNTGTNTRTFTVYSMEVEWIETQCTWLNRKTGVAWATAGATGAGDLLSSMGSLSIAGAGTGWREWTLQKADVQGWLDGAYPNYGMLVSNGNGDEDARNFYSREYATDPTLIPQLVLYFTSVRGGLIVM